MLLVCTIGVALSRGVGHLHITAYRMQPSGSQQDTAPPEQTIQVKGAAEDFIDTTLCQHS